MAIRAVIFDRDGVLTHFDFAPVEALFEGSPVPQPIVATLFTRWEEHQAREQLPRDEAGEAAYVARFWASVSDEWSLDQVTRRRIRSFDYTTIIRVFPDARDALRVARAHELRIGVLSNFPLVTLEASLVATGLRELVDVAHAATIMGAPKPEPAAYLAMVQALGVAPAECVLIDDEQACVAGANALGIHAYLLDRRGAHGAEGRPDVLSDLRSLTAIINAG